MTVARQNVSIKIPYMSIKYYGYQFFISFNGFDFEGLMEEKPSIGRSVP